MAVVVVCVNHSFVCEVASHTSTLMGCEVRVCDRVASGMIVFSIRTHILYRFNQ
jgi:hypothetical protein